MTQLHHRILKSTNLFRVPESSNITDFFPRQYFPISSEHLFLNILFLNVEFQNQM